MCVYVLCSNRVRLAATRALLNSLEFTKANFEKEVHIYSVNFLAKCALTNLELQCVCACVCVCVCRLCSIIALSSEFVLHV